MNLTDTQKILTNTTLVEYYTTVSQTVAFVVTSNEFHVITIAVTQKDLASAIQEFRTFPSLEGVPTTMQMLYKYLFAPVKPYVHTRNVTIAPYGMLYYVPFSALHDSQKYLLDEYTFSYIRSASILPFALSKRKLRATETPLILGDPDSSLPYSRQEADTIAKLYGVTDYVGKDATERLVWDKASEASIIHLAARGVYDPQNPLFSNVQLAADDREDGFLEVYEIYERGLNLAQADLVVLSACQTNVGALRNGDEIVGLNRALIYAGTPTVIASLWTVDDEATSFLMERFYTYLRQGISKAGALQAAQNDVRKTPKWSHPYYWAAFVLTGDPGQTISNQESPAFNWTELGSAGLLVLLAIGLLVRRNRGRS